MKRSVSRETEATETSIETESIIINISNRKFDHKIENSSNISVMSEEVARQIRAGTLFQASA